MRIISYGYTWPALVARRKTVTRRNPGMVQRFKAGETLQAWDKGPRVHGHKIGEVYVLDTPYPEAVADMPESDYEAEGFAFFAERPDLLPASAPRWLKEIAAAGPANGLNVFRQHLKHQAAYDGAETMWVVRFKLLRLDMWRPMWARLLPLPEASIKHWIVETPAGLATACGIPVPECYPAGNERLPPCKACEPLRNPQKPFL